MKLATDWSEECFTESKPVEEPRQPKIHFCKPSELRGYVPDKDVVLVGDCHIMRGEVFVIGGEPGVGKSTAATELAIAGAMKSDWLGFPVHVRFKTLIIQNENGRFRLRQEYEARGLEKEIEDLILVSEPPPYGMTLTDPEFLEDVKSVLESFNPDVVIFDPWNAAARDDKISDYKATFDALRNMLLPAQNKPSLGIVAHTRKPQPNEKRTGGSGMLHLLSGSYILGSVPRSVFIMVRGADDETDDSVILYNPKNSNGPCAAPTAWGRTLAGFISIPDFDWETLEGEDQRKIIRLEHIKNALGEEKWRHDEAVKRLRAQSNCGERACQKALNKNGKFATNLLFEKGYIGFRK